MARVGPTLDLGALTLAAFAAPGLSVVATLLIALTGAAFSGGADLARGVVGAFGMLMMAIVLVTLWGVLPAMAFGAGGAALAARVPASLTKWIGVWGLCGAATAGIYIPDITWPERAFAEPGVLDRALDHNEVGRG